MLGYRIKQTVFMLTGLIVCFYTWADLVLELLPKKNFQGNLGEIIQFLAKPVWLVICVGGGERLAYLTGGSDDLKRVKPSGLLSD